VHIMNPPDEVVKVFKHPVISPVPVFRTKWKRPSAQFWTCKAVAVLTLIVMYRAAALRSTGIALKTAVGEEVKAP